VSTIGSYLPAAQSERSATAGIAVCAVILAVFVLAAGLSGARKDITQGFDEVAHASYVAHIQSSGESWPALGALRMVDPEGFRFTDKANYLNHPSPYYALIARVGPTLEGNVRALMTHRFLNIIIGTLGLAAALAIGLAARLPRPEIYAYAVPLACIPVLAPLAGAINNDNLAFAGGALATLGAWQLIVTGRTVWLAIAFAGMIAAAWAKLTGLILVEGMVASVLAYLGMRRRLPSKWLIAFALAHFVAAAPYFAFIVQYGSPIPDTSAQMALLQDGARASGWSDAARLSFPAYAAYFGAAFVADWLPTLAQRGAVQYAALVIPVATLVCALAGFAMSSRRIIQGTESTIDVIVVAGMLAIATTLAVHVVYSYQRHLATGWLMDAYPRYYLPLAAIVPLACLVVLTAVHDVRRRGVLLVLLIAGPLLFRILGAPLG
jgi:hypothetical protein